MAGGPHATTASSSTGGGRKKRGAPLNDSTAMVSKASSSADVEAVLESLPAINAEEMQYLMDNLEAEVGG